ncbi:hypothetical protein [Actinomadura rudentiformis]|uniref:hypothetical protein n=1 Tax=Actinomadura rudentiformis TaxID=359158 RepID=UPI00384FF0D6
MEDYAFQTEGLVKRFGTTTALAGVDLHARPGTVLGSTSSGTPQRCGCSSG